MSKIKVPAEDIHGNDAGYVYLEARTLAQSAFVNDVSFDDFANTLDAFSEKSRSSGPQIDEWRKEAVDIFFDLLEQAGKLKLNPVEIFGGSDYEDSSDAGNDESVESETTLCDNKNYLS